MMDRCLHKRFFRIYSIDEDSESGLEKSGWLSLSQEETWNLMVVDFDFFLK